MNEQIKNIAFLEAQVIKSGRKYLEKQGFVEIVVPRIVRASGACENINTLFEVGVDKDLKWFNNKKGYLAQTGQLYLEALVPYLDKVYCVGPSFRAEPKVDSRHLMEFLMFEIEFAGGFKQLMQYIEGFINQIAKDIAALSQKELKRLGLSKEKLKELKMCPEEFPKITYNQAIEYLKKKGVNIEWGDDVDSKKEQILINGLGNKPIFITHYPDPLWNHGKKIEVEKFFNMLPDPENPGRVLSCDLILPLAGEAVGAAARVHQPEILKYRLKGSTMFKLLKERDGSLKDFSWYFKQVKDNNPPPHAGCGFGISRILKWLKGEKDIRNCVVFASTRSSLI